MKKVKWYDNDVDDADDDDDSNKGISQFRYANEWWMFMWTCGIFVIIPKWRK